LLIRAGSEEQSIGLQTGNIWGKPAEKGKKATAIKNTGNQKVFTYIHFIENGYHLFEEKVKTYETPPVVEVTEEKASEAIKALREAIDSNNPLSPQLKVAVSAISSYLGFYRLLHMPRITISTLRSKFGVQPPIPANSSNGGNADNSDRKGKKKKGGKHGKRGCRAFPDARKRYFAHPEYDEPGCQCPGCLKGRIFPDTGNWLRFYGEPFLKVVTVVYEIWRCNLCQAVYPAPVAKDLVDDGSSTRQFGYSAIAMIALSKYFFGTPWARQQRMQELLRLPITASTLYDQCKFLAKALEPIYTLLTVLAANAWLYYSDDTGIKILKLKPIFKPQRNTKKEVLRSGIHTSCIISELDDENRIILFKSGIIHAGEFLDEILLNRNENLPPPLHMSDGSSCNPATVTRTINCACNAHGKRKLDEKKELFPEHQKIMKAIYKKVYRNEDFCKEKRMDIHERLEYHKIHSKPLMDKLFDWMQDEMDEKKVEPNSMLGEIFNYFLKRKNQLMAFTEHPGAPIDNNTLELVFKLIALFRKNAMFFMTEGGAKIADIIMSVGATAGYAGANLFDYFVIILRYRDKVAENPELFLPWNYQYTVQELETNAREKIDFKELTQREWDIRQKGFSNSKIKQFKKKASQKNPESIIKPSLKRSKRACA